MCTEPLSNLMAGAVFLVRRAPLSGMASGASRGVPRRCTGGVYTRVGTPLLVSARISFWFLLAFFYYSWIRGVSGRRGPRPP